MTGDLVKTASRAVRLLRPPQDLRRALGVVLPAAACLLVGASERAGVPRSRADVPTIAGPLLNGSNAQLAVAGALAVAPNGALYVVDAANARILVQQRGGRFGVVAGNGDVGFSGDGGPAIRAELMSVSDMAFGSDGTLYIADAGRVRAVSRSGVIRTIAGDGRALRTITNGTPALSAPLGVAETAQIGDTRQPVTPLWIAIRPQASQLYISTGRQILRLMPDGRLETVRAVATRGAAPLQGFGPIAVDPAGTVYAGGNTGAWSVWEIPPDGDAQDLGFARLSGGADPIVELGPQDGIYVASGSTLFRVRESRLVAVRSFPAGRRAIVDDSYFPLTYFAFGKGDTLYADDIPGGLGFEPRQRLVAVKDGHVSTVWTQRSEHVG